jgi:signal transduction histidine kinase
MRAAAPSRIVVSCQSGVGSEMRMPSSANIGSLPVELGRRWVACSLLTKFMALSAIGTVAVMAMVGQWVADRIANGVVHASAAVSALYTDTFVQPHVQELRDGPRLSPENERTLDRLLLPQVMGKPIIGFRIWHGDTIVYSDRRELIGRTYPPSPSRQQAWNGLIHAEYADTHDSDHAPPGMKPGPMLETYAPVREIGTGRVIALAETYERATALQAELQHARIGTWLLVGAATLLMLAVQFLIVRAGSRTIDHQRLSLEEKIDHLQTLLDENRELRRRATQANGRVAEMNDRYLRRIGADLHDGPVQNLGVAMLRVDALDAVMSEPGGFDPREAREDVDVLRETLFDAVRELRNISSGLVLPELDALSPTAVLEAAARRHERRTGTKVQCSLEALPADVPVELKGCLYRLAQEGLTNAFRHADGNGQAIEARADTRQIELRVLDRGSERAAQVADSGHWRQGLIGLRDRLESLGGTFQIGARPGGGTCLTARIPLNTAVQEDYAHAH